jgi:hypothetical protein
MLGIGKALGTAGGVKDGEELSMLVTSPRGCLTGATGSGWLGSADEMSPCGAASGSSSVHLSTKGRLMVKTGAGGMTAGRCATGGERGAG